MRELSWERDGLYLRLTAQGPWEEAQLRRSPRRSDRVAACSTGRTFARGSTWPWAGGCCSIIGLFLTWYHADGLAKINGVNGDLSGWDVHTIMRWLLLLAGLAPFILAWIIARDHALSWPRGELTAVVSVAAFGLIAYNAFVSKPGDPSSLVHLRIGDLRLAARARC